MILELHDGTEIELPDGMSDAQVQAIVDAFTKSNAVANQALSAVSEMQAQLDLVRSSPPIPIVEGKGHEAVVAALARLQETMEQGFARLFAATMADTVVVDDPLRTEPTRSRKEIRGL